MLNRLIRFSLAQRPLVIAVAIVMLALGVRSTMELPVDVLPDLTKPTVTLLTEAKGYAPEEVETLITIPLENALMGVTGVTRLRTVTDVGLSLTFVEFDWGTDIDGARVYVQQRLAGIEEILPEGVSPYMTPVSSLMGDIMLVGVTDPEGGMSPRDLRTYADWTIGRRLQSIAGIAEVLAMGGGVKQLQVQPDPERMLALGITFKEVREAAAKAVSNTTGGFLTNRAQEIMVRNLAMTTDLDAIGDTVVRHADDRAVRIKDVADVVWDIEPMRGDAAANGHRGVILSVKKSPGFDTLALTREVEEALAELQEAAPEGVVITQIYRQADFIDVSIGNLKEAIRDGAMMVAIVLFLFLLNLRTTFITLTAIPLSLGIAVSVFALFGLSVNSMTLGGLAVAIGMVVDDAIVDVENVLRRLRENASRAEPLPKLEVIASASGEVRGSILYATVLIILVFLPLLGLSGVEGKLFAPIAIATIISMAASFVVSLTVIPVLASFLLRPKPGHRHKDGFLVRGMKWILRHTWLRLALAQPLVVMMIAGVLLALALTIYPQMGNNFLPPFREPTALVAMTAAPGTSLRQTNEVAAAAEQLLLAIPEVEQVGYRLGRAERGDHVVPISTVEFDIEFGDHGRPRSEILAEISNKMRGLPGTFSALSGPLADRIGHMLSGVSAPVAVKVFGPDLAEIQRIGNEIRDIARGIPGFEQARGEQQAPIPQLRIEIDRQRALAYGVTPGNLNAELAALLGGEVVSEVYEGQKIFNLVVRLPEKWRESPQRLANMYIDTLSGQRIPLKFVADLRQSTGPNNILRENTQRRFVVSIKPTTEDLVAAMDRLQEEVAAKVAVPEGYFISYEGEYQAQKDATRRITFMSVLVLLVIAFLLYGFFQTPVFTLQVIFDIPLALIGGIILTRLTLNNISIATLVGFIAVAGIAARNSIMMISHYLHLMRHEGEGFTREMIERGTLERLVPVLMTALAAGIALVPLVMNVGFIPFLHDSDPATAPGKEILNPVAIVIVGGLVTSTLLGLGVTPAVFWTFGRRAAEKAVRQGAPASH
ncbi:MAG: efflux RND transporter permease subunit [Akkermansiaceae bacterium]|nr:efflux RND transporter permease subunit [Akkermansiaceae bacterium]NNM30032.1 efflux RND transporter permease subunit [Akkermansiaceae bacterium]